MRGAEYIVKVLLEGQEYSDQWKPSQRDLDWTANLLRMMRDGSFWMSSEGIFKVDKTNKILMYAGPKGSIFHRVGKCAELLGWTVRHVSDNPDEKSFSA